MSVIRIKHQSNYVVISKTVLEDKNLSFKAKGVWTYCMSRPNDWEFHVSHLATVSKDGEDAIYTALKELEKEGYVRKIQKNEKGRFGSVDYEISEIKIILPLRDFPDAVNPALLSNELHQVKKAPPLTPPKPKSTYQSLNPTKEEDDEIIKRIKNRPKSSPPITNHGLNKYKETSLINLRNDPDWIQSLQKKLKDKETERNAIRAKEILSEYNSSPELWNVESMKEDSGNLYIRLSGNLYIRLIGVQKETVLYCYDISPVEWEKTINFLRKKDEQ